MFGMVCLAMLIKEFQVLGEKLYLEPFIGTEFGY